MPTPTDQNWILLKLIWKVPQIPLKILASKTAIAWFLSRPLIQIHYTSFLFLVLKIAPNLTTRGGIGSPTTLYSGKRRGLSSQISRWVTIMHIWGILVKLVICVYSGHPKIKITNFMKYAIFNWFLPWHTILLVKNWFGNLIALLTNILWDFHVPRRHRKN